MHTVKYREFMIQTHDFVLQQLLHYLFYTMRIVVANE